jgi:SAM-dependent methyltransferase
MEESKYIEMARIQSDHWWFRGRRTIFCSILADINLRDNATILEVGCGTGANLAVLKQFGNVYGIEMNDFSRLHAEKLSGVQIEYGRLPDEIPFAGKQFDLICLFDVLEHVKQDTAALNALGDRLSETGKIVITVPATKWLYGGHDKMLHHFRRYSKSELNRKIGEAGLSIDRSSYFNSLLFPIAVAARALDIVKFNGSSTGMNIPAGFINDLFYKIFTSEKRMIKKSLYPFGLSLIAVARKL